MNKMTEKTSAQKMELHLSGLDCANCAAKIEQEANAIPGVKANLNFLSRTLSIETESGVNHADTLENVKTIIHKHEPDIVIREIDPKAANKAGNHENNDLRTALIKLAAGGALFAAALILPWQNGLELAAYLASYLVLGGSIILRAIKGIIRGQVFNEHFLMSVATIGAFLVGAYSEGVAVMLFYLVGEIFQEMAVGHSRRSISALMDIRPDYANLKTGEELVRVLPEEINTGDIIVIKPGERVPLDGKVLAGTSLVDTSALTGESVPRQVEAGSAVLSGFINKNGVLTVEVEKVYIESTVSKILDLVQNASSRKAPTENFITKFARYYTPAVVFLAAALAVLPPLIVPGATFAVWVYRALIFLVVSCPCALVISIPLGFFGGIGGASKQGILVKGSNYLEALNQVDTVVFDKTGTLTKGVFQVSTVSPQTGFSASELLQYAACAELGSNHPIALSILSACGDVCNLGQIEDHREIAGQGIRVTVQGREILAGNSKLLAGWLIEAAEVETSGTVVHIAVDRQYAGYIIITDEIKEDAVRTIQELKALGVTKTVMLTGDSGAAGAEIGRQLGLDEVYAELLPSGKVEIFETLKKSQSGRGKMIFVGDGINDAPVLARSDIGVAMGGLGSDAAIEAADVVIMTDEPLKIATAIRIARKTRRIVLENIAFALGVKGIFLLLGALGVATMWEAVFADMGVALLAIFNALRVMNTKNL